MRVRQLSKMVKKALAYGIQKKAYSTYSENVRQQMTDLLEKIDTLLDEMPSDMDFGVEAGRVRGDKPLEPIGPCIGIIGKLFGHRFEPRYTDEKGAVDGEAVAKISQGLIISSDMKEMVSRSRTYECDVCAICGAVVITKTNAAPAPNVQRDEMNDEIRRAAERSGGPFGG